jgi:hypothetical protein
MAQTCDNYAGQRDDSGLYNGANLPALDENYMIKIK